MDELTKQTVNEKLHFTDDLSTQYKIKKLENGELIQVPKNKKYVKICLAKRLTTGESVIIKKIMRNPDEKRDEITRTQVATSILGNKSLELIGIFSDKHQVFYSLVMEKLEPWVFNVKDAYKLINDLKNLHENNFIHSDINPSNIMRSIKSNQAVFIDFDRDRSANFFYPIDIDEDKWKEYDLIALCKTLFILKHLKKINAYLVNYYKLDTEKLNSAELLDGFYKLLQEHKFNEFEFLAKIEAIAFEEGRRDSVDIFFLNVITKKIEGTNTAARLFADLANKNPTTPLGNDPNSIFAIKPSARPLDNDIYDIDYICISSIDTEDGILGFLNGLDLKCPALIELTNPTTSEKTFYIYKMGTLNKPTNPNLESELNGLTHEQLRGLKLQNWKILYKPREEICLMM